MITLDLRKRQSLQLQDVEGATLRVNRGCVWITQEDDTRDVVLRAGDTWTVERDGLTIIEAQGDTTLFATGGGMERLMMRRRPPRWAAWWRLVRARALAWYSLTPRSPLPH
ncbi:MAG: DUF2917 domain-containing protein [Burkholderiales bacterium]|nr:DUF2917 domain-containing protein [Burkholderiales bacterium]